ncbi:MAG: hypothetical protein E4H10_11935, partial [Bacteroidia bacterium]
MRNAGFVLLLMLGQLLLAQEGEVISELSSQDTSVISPEPSPEPSPEISPFISTEVSAEVPL